MHTDPLTVSESTVRRLVNDQLPAWRTLAITALDRPGTVHASFPGRRPMR